jgi:inositol-pentakisphosphate 2-kinase
MSTLPPLSSTSPRDWRYVAEGGANLVLSHSSTSDTESRYSGKVVRLRKCKKGGPALGGEADVEFNDFIIKPLLNQVAEMEKVQVEREWLQEIQNVLEERQSRPKERSNKDEIDLESKFAVVAEDLVGGEGVVAFEIKVSFSIITPS